MKSKNRLHFLPSVAWSAATLALGFSPSSLAADGTWTGGPAATWDTSFTNWSGVPNPAWDSGNGPSNVAIFAAAATPAVSGTVFANGITFNGTATVSGGTIILDGVTPTITTNAAATIASSLDGTAGCTKAGASILSLSADNLVSGGIILDGGTLRYTTSQTNDPGTLTFGATNGSVNTSALDLSTTPIDLTASGLAVRTNNATANTIDIGAAKTLTLPGAVSIGASTGTTNLTVTGATGSLAVTADGGGATDANFYVGGGGTAKGTVDMSGLGTFTADLGTGTFGIGNGSTNGTGTIPYSLILAGASSITATKVSVGGGWGNTTNASAYTLKLGSGTNTINTADLYVGTFNNQGRGNVNTALNFNTTTGTLTLRGLAGGSTRANVHIGENQGGSTGTASGGKFDLSGSASTSLSGGNVDLLINDLIISRRTAGSNDTSSMTFRSGTMDVNTLVMGRFTGTIGNSATGNLTLNGGTVIFNTGITLGINNSGTGTGTATLNVAGATVTATPGIVMGNQTAGTVNSNITVSSGSLTLGGDITKVGTTTSTLTVSGGTLNMVGNDIGTLADTINVALTSGTIRNLATRNGSATLVKSTGGTGTLLMDTTSFAGPVQVNSGTLILKADGFAANLPYQGLVTSGAGTGITLETTTVGSSLFLEEARSSYAGGSNPTLTFTGPGDIEIGATGVTAPSKQLIGIFNHTATVTLNGPWAYAGIGTSSQINSGTVIFKNNNLSGLKLANIGGGATAPVIDNQSGAAITNLSSGGTAGNTTLNGNFTFGSADTTGTLTLGSGINGYTLGTIEETTRTITVAGLVGNQLIISKPIADGTNGTTPTINLTKAGIGILTLSGASSYTGATTVDAGTLDLTGSLTNSSVEVKNTAILSGNGNIGGNLTIRTGGRHALAVADTEGAQVTRTITGILTLESGTILDLTAAAPPAGGIYVLATATGGIIGTPSLVNQTGVSGAVSVDTVSSPNRLLLTVSSASGFASWIGGFGLAPADLDPTDDPDNDGMDNLLEFVLNGNPATSDFGILPKLTVSATDFEFTYQRRDDSVSPETTQTFEWGTTLAAWPGSAVIPAANDTVGAATITVSAGVPSDAVTDTVKVSIPKSEAGATGKLFGRLKVEQ